MSDQSAAPSEKLRLLALDLTKNYPRSPAEQLGGYVLAGRMLDKCRAVINGTAGEYHFDCPLDNIFLGFAKVNANEFRDFVAAGATDLEADQWLRDHAEKIPDIERIKWNNHWSHLRISELPDGLQEFTATYVPENVPRNRRAHFFFDIFDLEEERI
jgi:hypothetical protein